MSDHRTTNMTSSSSARRRRAAGSHRGLCGGVSVGVVCKSLLGSPHVMAEVRGGAIGNVTSATTGEFTLPTHARRAYLNNRHGQLHAKEAPECVNELETWGACSNVRRRQISNETSAPPLPRLACRRRTV